MKKVNNQAQAVIIYLFQTDDMNKLFNSDP